MFFTIAILSTIGYSVQSTLMASYYRRMDRLSAVAYRGLSLGITMMPLLLFVPRGQFGRVISFLPHLGAASFVAALANWCMANAYSFLPVGIASALTMSFTAVVVVLLGFIFLAESLTGVQLCFIGLILAGVVVLGVIRSSGPLPREYSVRRGVINSIVFGLLIGVAFSLIGSVSRQLDPFLAGYSWELIIGVLAICAAVLRRAMGGAPLQRLSARETLKISLYCAPTAAGTGLFALATTMGAVGIVSAIMSSIMVFNTLFAFLLYREKLTLGQWSVLAFICSMVIGLRVTLN